MSRRALLLIVGGVVALLSWVGIAMFRSDPTPAPASEVASIPQPALSPPAPAPSVASPVVSEKPLPPSATETAEGRSAEIEPRSTAAKPVESNARESGASPVAIGEVIPDVPRSARETIRGRIRVSIRVIVDKEGAVVVATADEPGPSRYFERLATEAAKKWTFAPAAAQEQRIMLVRFYFTRAGTTARASSVQ